jgi:predicted N-acyltransferase
MISVKIVNSILEVDQKEWNEVCKNDYFMSVEYLYHVEQTMVDGYKYWYICIYKNDLLVLVASLFSMGIQLDTLLEKGLVKKLISSVRKIFRHLFMVQSLIVGSPPSVGNFGVSVKDGQTDKIIFDEFLKTIEIIAKKEKIQLMMIKEVPNIFVKNHYESLKQASYSIAYDLPNNILDLPWKSFDDYLLALRKKYRQTIKKSRDKLISPNIIVEEVFDIRNQYGDAEYDLYLNVLGRSETIFETLTMDYFTQFDQIEKMSTCLLSIKHNGIIIGYFLVADTSDSEIAALFAGINYDCKDRYDTYFNLFYEVITYALKNGKKRIYFGQNTYEVKQRIGCVCEELHIVLKHRNRCINHILHLIKDYLLPEKKIEPKKVLK